MSNLVKKISDLFIAFMWQLVRKTPMYARTIKVLEETGAMEYVTIVSAPAADNPANQYLAPYAGCAMVNGLWKTVVTL